MRNKLRVLLALQDIQASSDTYICNNVDLIVKRPPSHLEDICAIELEKIGEEIKRDIKKILHPGNFTLGSRLHELDIMTYDQIIHNEHLVGIIRRYIVKWLIGREKHEHASHQAQ